MNENPDLDETLREYGYSQGSKAKHIIGYLFLSILLIGAVAVALLLGKLWTDEKSNLLQAEQSFKTLTRRLSEMETRNSELSSLLSDKQAEIERLREEWSSQVSEMENDHKEQLQRAFAQMNEIVYDSKKTLTYINDIEGRLRTGQKIDLDEAKKLSSVVNGLTFLHEQYKKPIAEFRELDRYFQKQLASIPSSSSPSAIVARPVPASASSQGAANSDQDPAETTGLLKKLFNNKKYKEQREAYLREQGRSAGVAQGRVAGQQEGRRQALTEAQRKVKEAYSRAQAQMNALALDKNKFLAQLDQLVASNNQSAADVEDFFSKSKEILRIHDQIMNIEPAKPSRIRP